VSRSQAAVVLATALAVSACQRAPLPTPHVQPTASFETLRADADTRLRQRDWVGAVRAYEAAVTLDPANMSVRYGLGIALAQLDRHDAAAAAFVWVVEHGPIDSEEVRIARQWLTEAGVRPGRVVAEVANDVSETTGGGVVQGNTEWKDLDPTRPRPNVQIVLDGDDDGTRGRRYWAKVPLNDPYRIEKVTPGRYRLLAQVGPTRLWETTVSVAEGRATVFNLTQAMSVAPADSLRPIDH